MWLESLRMGSWRRNEYDSPWLSPTDAHSEPTLVNGGSRKICPASILEDAYLGCRNKTGIIMLHHPECFTGSGSDANVFTTPIQKVEIIDMASRRKRLQDRPTRSDSLLYDSQSKSQQAAILLRLPKVPLDGGESRIGDKHNQDKR